ncbi:MAG: hypothetical protein J2P57_17815 [Acidimicrobiaceae bacterium]|nr:hypothetical protein [Acidimicrobiaceae bacterium]
MEIPDPGGGGSYASPDTLTLLDVRSAAYVKGVWEGYQDALAWARNGAERAIPTANQWQGDRAERFRSWWRGASADLDSLANGISTVVSALEIFILSAPQVNEYLATIEHLVKSNCTNYQASPPDNWIFGDFTVNGNSYWIEVTGVTINSAVLPSPWPPWIQALYQAVYDAEVSFQAVSDSVNEYVRGALASFTSMHQFRHLGRSSAPGDDVHATSDPTWQQLTGGGVFRMPLQGFSTDPFGTKIMPSWYDPTMGQRVSEAISKYSWVGDILAIVVTAAGQPEVGVGIEVVMHGTKLALDVSDGDTAQIPWDAVDLILDVPGAPSLESLAGSITKRVIYQARHAIEPSLLPEINGKLAAFVQARLKEQVQEQVLSDGTTHTVIPASALAQVEAEAAAELEVLAAAHVPESAMSGS